MKTTFALILAHSLALTLTPSVQAKGPPDEVPAEAVEVLPPDVTLFGRTRGEFHAEWMQHTIPLSTNGDYRFPNAVPSATDPVYFLQRPIFGVPPPDIQNYFVPDDVYVCFPIVNFWGDNVDTWPPFTVDELRTGVNSIIDVISGVHVIIDGIVYTNLQAYRTETPVFSLFFPSSDNFYTAILGHPLEGIVDPVVAGGYLLMLKPLPAGLHDVRLGATIGGPNNFSFRRHFQIYSLTLPQQLTRATEQLEASVTVSPLPSNRSRPLLASLEAARASFGSDRLDAGVNQLRAFQNKVRAQVSPADEDLAFQLVESAQAIIEKAAGQLNRTKQRSSP